MASTRAALLIALAASARAQVTFDFQGKVCYISGGTSGIGKAAVLASAKAGCNVLFTGRDEERGAAVAKEAGATFFKADATDEAQVKASVDAAMALGGLDFAFNNAGGGHEGDLAPPHALSVADFRALTELNLIGVFAATKYQVEAMLAHGKGGSIVNCGSIAGIRAFPGMAAAYTVTKHAVAGLTKAFALAYATAGIRVNTIAPGFTPSGLTAGFVAAEAMGVKTVSNWHPAGRFLENSEVVDGLHWLWSDASSFYNGQELVLDSGLTQAMVTPTLYQQDVGAMMAALAPADAATEL